MGVIHVEKQAATARSSRSKSGTTRARLLEAGQRLFARKGSRDVTSHEIAAEAGYASGTFYLHFKDKHALFGELADEAAAELEARIDAVFANKTEPADILHAHAEVLVGFAEERRDLLRILFQPDQLDAEAGAAAERILQRLADGLSARRRERLAAAETADCFDTDVLAQAIVGMWSRVLVWWAEDPNRARREDLVRTLTQFHLHGTSGSTVLPV
jgi:AcrR family transcriptional regulator